MKTFAINTLGCKVNQYESQQVRQFLEQLGLEQVKLSDQPNIILINTCCVTGTASAKSRQQVHKAKKLNPASTLVIFGCLPTIQTGEFTNFDKNIHLVRDRHALAGILTGIVTNETAPASNPELPTNIKPKDCYKIKFKNKLSILPELSELTSFTGHTRAFLKIQDGCDGWCTYCIIPKTRPVVHSKSPETVLKEAKKLVESGHKEIVLTGIFLGAFGQNTVRRNLWKEKRKNALPDLLDKLAKIPNLARIRLSSLEPADATKPLLDTFVRCPNIMPHLHLSLQSGSDNVLKKMCRQYCAAEFLEKVEMIKSHLDRPAITADMIVGFPGEADEDFQATVELAKRVGFAKMHVFAFSPRAGTAAARMKGQASKKLIKQRSQILRDLDIELGRKFRDQFIGQPTTVLLENSDEKITGRTERYFSVTIEPPNKNLKPNDLVKVRITKNTDSICTGHLI